MNEDLRNWFRDKWVRMNTKGDIIGDCARDEGEGKPKCLPLAKARTMSKDDRAAATRRKRREDPVADRSGKGEKPVNVATIKEQTIRSLNWKNKEPADYAIHLSKFFGQPDSTTDEELVWESKDGFKRIVVKDEYILHSSPAPHYDFIYCYVDLIVPVKYATALAESSGSILIDFLKGEVGARCGSITANATTINYVLDVVAGRVKPSKEEYEKRILSMSSMFSRGKKFELDWWPDETKDADPSNSYYKDSTNEHFKHCGCDVIQEISTSDLIKKSHSKRGAPGTLKAKVKGTLTLAKVRSLKNRANATTLDKKQANFYINMHSEEYLEEKNVPTNPGLWARAKTLARSKFDVYPSAYANGWAAKWYKGKGGSWKSVQEGTKMKTLKDILSEGVAVSSDFKLVNSVDAQGKPTTRKVRAHRKTINPQSEDKSDVLSSIQKFVGRQYNEGVNDPDHRGDDNNEFDELEGLASKSVMTGSELNRLQLLTKKYGIKSPKDMDKLPAMKKDAEAGYKKRQDEINTETEKRNQQHLQDKLTDMEYAADPASFLKRRTQKEEVEQIDEISKELTHSYFKKFVGRQYDEEGVAEGSLNELSKDTLKSYAKKAVPDMQASQKRSQIEVGKAASTKDDKTAKTHYDAAKQARDRTEKRMAGISGAIKRVTNQGVAEEVEQVDEISKELTHSYFKKSIQDKSKENRKQRMSGQGRAVRRLTNKLTLPDQVAKEYSDHKPGQYVGDSYEPQGQMVEGQSASMRMFKALQQAKKQREEEEARKAANEKRAQTPKYTNEAKDPREYDYEGDMAKTQLRSIIANSQAVHDMLKDTTNLAEWVQSKITKAEDYISTVADYMTAEMNEQYVGTGDSKDMQRAVDKARMIAKSSMLKGIHGDNYQDKQVPDHDESDVKVSPNDKGGYSASLKLTPKSKPQAATNEAKEDDDEDYTKHHKLDPDSGVEADQHIHVQLKKAIDSTMKPYEVSFKNGKKHTVSSPVAKTIVTAIEKLKPEHRKFAHDELHKSYDSLMAVHKAITGK